ncbi:MAG TPA: hypothetical protein VL614_20265 [Acetobacteraceae bacterium]|nr:hypothetical protein [Acetobacteraceae bacterium]
MTKATAKEKPKIKRTVLDYSDGCKMLEAIVPAGFETVELKN